MLLQFLVENFRSIHKEALLSMVPAKSRIHPEHVLKSEEKGRKVKALPIAVFYGANASGKSNLISAMAFAKKLIIEGTRGESSTGTVPFRLASDALEKPSRFEFVIKHDGVLYTYGFLVSSREIQEEWLFAVLNRQEVLVFERFTENGKAHIELGKAVAPTTEETKRLQFVAAGTRPNQLFLTEANERNVEGLKPLMQWFRDYLTIIWPGALYTDLLLRAYRERQFADFLSTFLRIADTGIQGIELKAEKLDFDRDFSDMPDSMRKSIINDLDRDPGHAIFLNRGKSFFTLRQEQDKTTKLLSLWTSHKSTDGALVSFDTRDESDGTHRLMHMVPALLDMQSKEIIYVIDELDRSMHPLLCRLYVEAFLKGIKDKKSRGQMILTTHDTCLMDLDLLRRDEIWFVEKDTEGSSHITSLAEFKYDVRADLKIAKGYLNGRFGAIPFLGDIRQLFNNRGND